MVPDIARSGRAHQVPSFEALRSAIRVVELLPLWQSAVGVAKIALALALLSRPPGPTVPVIVLLTVSVYAHNDLTDLDEDAVNDAARTDAIVRRKRSIGVVVVGAAVGALAGAATGGPWALSLVLVPFVLGVCYNAPVLPGPGPDRLKDVLVVNTTVTAAAWAVPVGLLPVAFGGLALGPTAVFACGYVFVRTFVASEFANVPDVEGDRAAGVRTLPTVVGPGTTRRLLAGVDALTVVAIAGAHVVGVVTLPVALALASGVVVSLTVMATSPVAIHGDYGAALKDLEFPVAAIALVLAGLA